MQFGFILPNLISPIANANALTTTARLAELVGFDSIWTTDHILAPVEHPRYAHGTEAITTLAYLAGLRSASRSAFPFWCCQCGIPSSSPNKSRRSRICRIAR